MDWQTFLSYSRQQYHTAELLVLNLQSRGISIWFDVQQLEPGTQWQADIQDGLDRSETVLLIASEAALASPYVEREWKHALAQNRRVIVALVERVRLPPDLRHAPVVDCRGNLDACVALLCEAILNPQAALPHVSHLPRLPEGVWRALYALFLRDFRVIALLLLTIIMWLMAFQWTTAVRFGLEWLRDAGLLASGGFSIPWLPELGVLFILLMFAPALLDMRLIGFLRRDLRALVRPPPRSRTSRRVSPYQYTLMLWAVLASGHLPFVRANYDAQGDLPVPLDTLVLLTGAGIALVVIGRASRRFLPALPNVDILRWVKPTSDTNAWRAELYKQWISEVGINRQVSYIVRSEDFRSIRMRAIVEPADRRVLDTLQPLMNEIGGRIVPPEEAADYSLLILSHASSRQRIAAALADGSKILAIIASRFSIPPGMDALGKVQFVDFSHRDKKALLAHLRLLIARDDTVRGQMQVHLKPVNLARISPAFSVEWMSTTLFLLTVALMLTLGMIIVVGNAVMPVAAAGALCGVTVVLLGFSLQRVRSGRLPMPRPLMILMACWTVILTLIMVPPVLPDVTTALGSGSLPLPPRSGVMLITTVVVNAGALVLLLLRYPHVLSRGDMLGMPRIPLKIRQILMVVVICAALSFPRVN